MNIPEIIEIVCKEIHLPMIRAAFGQAGIDAAFQIMGVTKSLYRHVELERVAGQIVIFQTILPYGATPASSVPTADFASFANLAVNDLILEIASDGRAYLRTSIGMSLEDLAKNAVVYHWYANQEHFLAGDGRKLVPPTCSSRA
jgi:hypothetical protein